MTRDHQCSGTRTVRLRAAELVVGYATGLALGPLSFEIDEHTCLVVQGPNGSGKTTLLRTLAGLHRPLSGQVIVPEGDRGKRSSAWVALDRTIVPAHMTNSELWDLVARRPKQGQRLLNARAVTEALDLDPRPRPFGVLSDGEFVKSLLVAAFCGAHDFIFLDEPTNALDSTGVTWLVDAIATAEIPVVLASHDPRLGAIPDAIQIRCGVDW